MAITYSLTVNNNTATKEQHETAINNALSKMQDRIDGVSLGGRVVGEWAASSGSFPTTRPDSSAIQAGDTFVVSADGTVDSVAFVEGDRLIALDAGGGATYSGNWQRAYLTAAGQVSYAGDAAPVGPGSTNLDGAIGWLVDRTHGRIRVFETRALAAAASTPATEVELIEIIGTAARDYLDGGRYVSVASEPTYGGLQIGGRWFQFDIFGHRGEVRPEQLGAAADGVTLDTTAVDDAFGLALSVSGTALLRSGAEYLVGNFAYTKGGGTLRIRTDGAEQAILVSNDNTGEAIFLSGDSVQTTTLANNLRLNSKKLTVADATGIEPGHILHLKSSTAWYHDSRSAAGITHYFGDVAASTSTTITLDAAADAIDDAYNGLYITICDNYLGGKGYRQSRLVTDYNGTTKVATVDRAWSSNPTTSQDYTFPQLFKGETHLVRAVSGNEIELADQSWDTYDVDDSDGFGDALEVVNIVAYNPIKADIENVFIRRDTVIEDTIRTHGFWFEYALDPVLRNCKTEYATGQGASFRWCYRPRVYSGDFNFCNHTTSGYGISTWACHNPEFYDAQFFGNRRGADFSGDTPTRLGIMEGCKVFGGGVQQDGTAYKPLGTVDNFGLGSHSTAEFCTYRNNTIGNIDQGIQMRGRNETAEKNLFVGHISNCSILLNHGANSRVIGNEYSSVISDGSNIGTDITKNTESFNASNIYTFTSPNFVRITAAHDEGYVEIYDNVARDVENYFCLIDGADTPDLAIQRNTVRFRPSASSEEVALIGTSGASLFLSNSAIYNNEIDPLSEADDILAFGAGISYSSTTGVINKYGSSAYSFFLADDTAIALPVAQNARTHLRVAVTFQGSTTFFFTGWLVEASATGIEIAGGNYEILAVALTGTNGTDGRLQLSFVDNKLYIGNRVGSTRTFNVEVFPTG